MRSRRNRKFFMALYELLRPTMQLWHASLLAQAPAIAQPSGSPRSGVERDAVDRVLLVGNGPLHGWGVLSHELSAVGHLSRALVATTGRRAVVDYVGDARMTAATSLEWLGERAADGYDVVVVVLSMNDALRLAPIGRFTEHYGRLVQRILADLDPRAEVVLMTLPHVSRYALVEGWAGAVAKRHAQRLSERVRRTAVGLDRVRVVEAPIEHFSAGRPHGSSDFYADWAEQAVVSIAPVVDRVRRRKPATADRRPERSALVRAATATPDPALVRLSEQAKERFDVAVAGVSLVDGDRIAVAAQTGGAPSSMPRSLMYCGAVFSSGAPVVVLDRRRDHRYRHSELIDLLGTPFYTGLPLHAADGSVVGAFCLLDSATHHEGFAPIADLLPFATEAEALLQRLAASTPPVAAAAAAI
jgi:lysophospholipase L1-like esterase